MKKIAQCTNVNRTGRRMRQASNSSRSLFAITLFFGLTNPALAQTSPTVLTDDILDQVRAGSTAVNAVADARATGPFSLIYTTTNASVANHLYRRPVTIGQAQGGALAIGQNAQTDAHSGGAVTSGFVLSGNANHHTNYGPVRISVSYHTTVAISF